MMEVLREWELYPVRFSFKLSFENHRSFMMRKAGFALIIFLSKFKASDLSREQLL